MAKKPTQIEEAISEALSELRGYDADSDEYQKIVEQISRLHAMKVAEQPCRVSRDTLAMIAGNIAVALIVVGYEQGHIVTSKIWNFLPRTRW